MSPRTGTHLRSASACWHRAICLAPLLAIGAWLMALALNSPAFWWLGWVTLLPLFFSIRVLPPVQSFAAGAVWGSTLFLSSLRYASDVPQTWFAFGMLAVVPGAYAALASRVTQRRGFHPLLLGLGWVGVELALRPLAMHHGLLAHTQGDSLLVQTVGNLGGYILVAFVLALINAALLSALLEQTSEATGTRYVLVPPSPGWVLPILDRVRCIARALHRMQPRAPPRGLLPSN